MLAGAAASLLAAGSGCGKATSQQGPRELAEEPSAAGQGGAAGGSEAGASQVPEASAGQPAGGEAGAPVDPTPPGVVLSAVTVSQTQELPLMRAGSAVATEARPAPLVANKRALVRAFVEVEPGFVARQLLGVLDLKTPQVTRTLVSARSIAQSSLQDDLNSTFDFDVDAADLNPNSSYRVRVLEADTTPLARFPDTGYLELAARVLPAFQLVVVPFISNGFAPKTGDDELQGLRRRLLALYPSSDVVVSVAEPVTLPFVVNAAGDGWDNALDLIYQLRAEAAPAHDVFYFGAMAPGASFNGYCASDCILGFSTVADDSDVDSRGSIGITVFQDGSGVKDAWDTVAHELGHAMGREHAPCGISDPSDVDADYPYANGTLGGIYGYDFDLKRLVKPKPAKDVMSYCTPVWISDYTYRGLFERLDYIASESFRTLAFTPSPLFRLARIRRDGESVWLGERRRSGRARRLGVALLDRTGQEQRRIDAEFVAVDHAAGGYVWLPELELKQSGADSVDLRPLGGAILTL